MGLGSRGWVVGAGDFLAVFSGRRHGDLLEQRRLLDRQGDVGLVRRFFAGPPPLIVVVAPAAAKVNTTGSLLHSMTLPPGIVNQGGNGAQAFPEHGHASRG